MGIHQGIMVVRQITDEWRWFQAMQEVERTFKNDKIFKILPRFSIGEFECERLRKFFYDEDQNFHKNGMRNVDWDWRSFPYEWDISKLKSKYSELNKKKVAYLEERRKKGPFTFHYRNSWNTYDQRDLEKCQSAIDFMESCTQEMKENILAAAEKYSWRSTYGTPILYEFTIEEHLFLPVFGRHFKNCTSKMSNRGDDLVGPTLEKIYCILKRHFPGNITHWFDPDGPVFDDYADIHADKLLKDGAYMLDDDAKISKEHFYKEVDKVFNNISSRKKVHHAREALANNLRY